MNTLIAKPAYKRNSRGKQTTRRRKHWYVNRKIRKIASRVTFDYRDLYPEPVNLLRTRENHMNETTFQMPKMDKDLADFFSIARKVDLLSDIHENGAKATLKDKFGAEKEFVSQYLGKSERFIEEELERITAEYFTTASRKSLRL